MCAAIAESAAIGPFHSVAPLHTLDLDLLSVRLGYIHMAFKEIHGIT